MLVLIRIVAINAKIIRLLTRSRSPKNGQIKNPVKKPEKTVSGIKRMVLIDGNNVAYQ